MITRAELEKCIQDSSCDGSVLRTVVNASRRWRLSPERAVHWAEDAVQEAFTKALTADENSWENPQHFKSWICRVAFNTMIDRLRREKRYEVDLNMDLRIAPPNADGHLAEAIDLALAELTPEERDLFQRRYIEDEDHRTIGLRIDRGAVTIWRRLKKWPIGLSSG